MSGDDGESLAAPAGDTGEDDASLRRRFAAGDDAAFAALMRRYGPMLRRFADERLPARLRRRISGADVLQEASLVAHERRAEFEDRGDHSFRNWLMKIVELKLRETVRHHEGTLRRTARREEVPGRRGDPAAIADGGPSPSQAAIGVEMLDLARRALLALSADQREIVRLVREERLKLADVAARTGTSHEAAKKAYGRAMARYTTEFRRLWGETRG